MNIIQNQKFTRDSIWAYLGGRGITNWPPTKKLTRKKLLVAARHHTIVVFLEPNSKRCRSRARAVHNYMCHVMTPCYDAML